MREASDEGGARERGASYIALHCLVDFVLLGSINQYDKQDFPTCTRLPTNALDVQNCLEKLIGRWK